MRPAKRQVTALEMARRFRSEVSRVYERRRRQAGRIEHRLIIRMIVLAIGLWTAITLGWSGSPVWVWVGCGALISAGHAYSWRYRNHRSAIRAVLIASAILALVPLVPGSVEAGATGNWLPAANLTLMFQGFTAFELRTRVGLNASIVLSGVAIFFTTQQAMDPLYGVFLTGFTALVLAFLALTFLIDRVDGSDVHWFKSRFGFAWYWSGVLVAFLGMTTFAFLILPKGFLDPRHGAKDSVLPFRNAGAFDGGALLPEFAALPVTALDLADTAGEPTAGASSDQNAGGRNSPEFETPNYVPGENAAPVMWEGSFTNGPADPGYGDRPQTGEEVVMQVRSPVLTYWRGGVFDEFDGQRWRSDHVLRPVGWNGGDQVLLAAQQGPGPNAPLYPQTYFMLDEPPTGVVFTGYQALSATVPSDDWGAPQLKEGSSYRVISTFPDFSKAALERAGASSRLDLRYHSAPKELTDVQEFARRITDLAHTDLSCTQRVVGYLDTNYTFDHQAEDQLKLSAPPLEFLTRRDKGTSMDFATASVLLARGAGIPARLVVGYLPGKLDPLSGTYVVRRRDAHVWSEVFFGGVGWVPFDSVPRPETAAFGAGGTSRSPLASSMFQTSLGARAYEALARSPDTVNDLFDRGGFGPTALAALGGSVTLGVIALLVRVFVRASLVRSRGVYSQIEGADRREISRMRRRVDRILAKVGHPVGAPADTIAQRWDSATRAGETGWRDLGWLKHAAWAAAYDPAPLNPAAVDEARRRVERLERRLRDRTRSAI